MLSKSEVDLLLSLPKITPTRHVDFKNHKTILHLTAKEEPKIEFRLHITNSKKIRFKLHCHHDHETIGLIRVDFYSGHRNPSEITKDVPEFLHQYVGMRFTRNDHHVHIYVENQELKWAVPIKDSFINIRDIKSDSDIITVINELTSHINLETKLIFALSTC